MKHLMITLCCMLSIAPTNCMQQPSSSHNTHTLECRTSIAYVQKLLESSPCDRCTQTYYPQAAYLQELVSYFTAHAHESIESNPVSMAMIEPLTFHLHLSHIACLLTYEQQALQQQRQSCTCVAATVDKLLNDQHYQGKSASQIAYSKIITLLARTPFLERDRKTLSRAQPPISQQAQQHVRNEHEAIIATLTRIQGHIPASDIALSLRTQISRAPSFCLPCKLSVVGVCALLVMQLFHNSALPNDVMLQNPVITLPTHSAQAPYEMLLPHIRQALEDIFPMCDVDGYTKELA